MSEYRIPCFFSIFYLYFLNFRIITNFVFQNQVVPGIQVPGNIVKNDQYQGLLPFWLNPLYLTSLLQTQQQQQVIRMIVLTA